MEPTEDSPNYTKTAIILAVSTIIVIVLAVFVKGKLYPKTPKVEAIETTSERTIKNVDKITMDTVYDLTTFNIASGQTTTIRAKFVSADVEDRVIDGERYVYAIGVQNDDGSLTRVHMRRDEYEAFGGTLPLFKYYTTQPVVLELSSQGISLYADN